MKIFYAAAYIRLSREDGDKAESDSIGNQRKLITDYVKEKEDLAVYDTYIEMKLRKMIQSDNRNP